MVDLGRPSSGHLVPLAIINALQMSCSFSLIFIENYATPVIPRMCVTRDVYTNLTCLSLSNIVYIL